jgi:hypothetical protein
MEPSFSLVLVRNIKSDDEMNDVVIFHLKKFWEGRDLWKEIKTGQKTSEWRDVTPFWFNRLCLVNLAVFQRRSDISNILKVHKAWFVVGYPKGNLPRLEVEIVGLFYHSETNQLEIKFANVEEILGKEN